MKQAICPVVECSHNPKEIHKNLAKDFGAVIVNVAIPAGVIKEITSFLQQRPGAQGNYFELYKAPHYTEPMKWSGPKQAPTDIGLSETRDWLTETFNWAVSAKLCRDPKAQINMPAMRILLNDAASFPWHFDKQLSESFPDTHLHIAGAGLQIANPGRRTYFDFRDDYNNKYLCVPDDPYEPDEQTQTEYLKDMGVEIMQLKPGQMVFFNKQCLHSSAPGNGKRARAIVF